MHAEPTIDQAELQALAGDPAGRAILDAAAVEIEQRVRELRARADEGERLAIAIRNGLARATQ